MKRLRGEHGAAAVEFALIAPILILLVLGIIEFSRAYNTQISLTSAAREGARSMAINGNAADAVQKTEDAAPSLNPALAAADIAVLPAGDCPSGGEAKVTITYHMAFFSGLFGDGVDLTGKGVMRCNG